MLLKLIRNIPILCLTGLTVFFALLDSTYGFKTPYGPCALMTVMFLVVVSLYFNLND